MLRVLSLPFAVAVLSAPLFGAPQLPIENVREVLLQTKQAHLDSPPIMYNYTNCYKLFGPKHPYLGRSAHISGTVRYDGTRLEIIEETGSILNAAGDRQDDMRVQYLWDGTKGLASNMSIPETGESVQSAWVTDDSRLSRGTRPDSSTRCLDGVLLDSTHYADLLLDTNDLQGNRNDEYVEISGTTPWGHLEVQLTPSPPYNLVGARFDKAASSMADDPVHETSSFSLHIQEREALEGYTVPTKGVLTYSLMGRDGTEWQMQHTLERTQITVHPDFAIVPSAFQFTVLPDVLIEHRDIGGLYFELHEDGGLTPRVPEVIEESIARSIAVAKSDVFQPMPQNTEDSDLSASTTRRVAVRSPMSTSSSVGRFPLWALALPAVVCAVLGVLLWLKRRPQSTRPEK